MEPTEWEDDSHLPFFTVHTKVRHPLPPTTRQPQS